MPPWYDVVRLFVGCIDVGNAKRATLRVVHVYPYTLISQNGIMVGYIWHQFGTNSYESSTIANKYLKVMLCMQAVYYRGYKDSSQVPNLMLK